ncbi:hypothetical protein IKU74_08050 [bacterium]|nr:hypothetical protein [bacterium]
MQQNFEERRLASELVKKTLLGYIPAREALLKFPPDTKDKSVQAAFHALVHFEADEDLRKRDLLYKEEQDEYLETISQILETGEDLPNNIIKNYEIYYKEANLPHADNARGNLNRFFRYLNLD